MAREVGTESLCAIPQGAISSFEFCLERCALCDCGLSGLKVLGEAGWRWSVAMNHGRTP